jgi:glycosyltransferase involved in cell wall biosynthesis
MKICIVAPPCIPASSGKEYSGSEKVAWLLANELGKNNEVTLVAAKGSEKGNFRLIESIEPGYSTPYENREFLQWEKVKPLILKEKWDVIDFHSRYYPINEVKNIARKICISYHDLNPQFVSYPLTFIARSKFHAEYLEKKFGWDIEWCYNPIKIEDYKFRKEKEDFFLFLGRMSYYKGPIEFVKICKELNLKGIMAGEDSIERGISPNELMGIFKELNGKIEYLGRISEEEKIDLLSRAKALISPLTEPYMAVFDLVIVEALASGTPVFTVDRGSPRELLNGLRLTPYGYVAKDLEELKKALKDFIEGKVGFESTKLRERAKEFSPEKIVNKYVEILGGK